MQVSAGLAAVHKQKLVHRDIKPSNIMVSFEAGGAVTAKIIDLGLAKAVNERGSQTAIFHRRIVLCTILRRGALNRRKHYDVTEA